MLQSQQQRIERPKRVVFRPHIRFRGWGVLREQTAPLHPKVLVVRGVDRIGHVIPAVHVAVSDNEQGHSRFVNALAEERYGRRKWTTLNPTLEGVGVLG